MHLGRREVPLDRGDRRDGKIDRSFISRLLLLTLLAPDIQEAILEGRQAKGMQLEELTGRVSSAWEKQRERFAPPDRIRDPMF